MITAGVDCGGTKSLAALVDGSGSIIERVWQPTDASAGTATVIAAVEALLRDRTDAPRAIGVGAAAWVEYPSGRILFAPNMTYENPDVAEAIISRFGLPCCVENDTNAAAWAEYRFGAGTGVDHMVMLTIGTGIGGAIVIGGELYRGSRGFAAEFGHIVIDEEGPPCGCGQRGCLETLASGTAIVRMAVDAVACNTDSLLAERMRGSNTSSGALVTEAARSGDTTARSILERAGRALGLGLANLAQAFNPSLVVLGGSVVDAGDLLLEPARAELSRRLGRRELPCVVTTALGGDAGVIGAADLARERLGT